LDHSPDYRELGWCFGTAAVEEAGVEGRSYCTEMEVVLDYTDLEEVGYTDSEVFDYIHSDCLARHVYCFDFSLKLSVFFYSFPFQCCRSHIRNN